MSTRISTLILACLCWAAAHASTALANNRGARPGVTAVPAAPLVPASRAGLPSLSIAPGIPALPKTTLSINPAGQAPMGIASPAPASAASRLEAAGRATADLAGSIAGDGGAENGKGAADHVQAALEGGDSPLPGEASAVDARTPDELAIAEMAPLIRRMDEQYKKVVVGQSELGRAMRLALWAGGHALAEGLPGTAKTRSVKAIAAMTGLDSSRIQFTRDLQPFDITGQEEKNRKTDEWEIRKGPVFANVILADEINRAKSQAQGALLQPMEEGHVSLAGQTLSVPQPFMVLATQNPIEDDGTYPLPRAQLDRFMFKIKVPYLGEGQIAEMLDVVMNEDETPIPIEQILDVEKVMQIRRIVRRIKISAEIKRYIERLVLATRPEASALDSVKKFVRYGASDRSAVTLMKAARAQAFEQGRASVLPEDVLAVAHWVLDHRVILSYEAEGDGGTTQEKVVEEILKNVPPVTAK